MVLILEDEYGVRSYLEMMLEECDIPFISYNDPDQLILDLQKNNLQNIDTAIIDLGGGVMGKTWLSN
ncbi:MAG: hypothetical protein PHT40_01720 [Patescibacteria group bacterium]|nr:hypothetical protein [Patescibacteria group bacterium]